MAKKKTWDDIKKMAEQNNSSQTEKQPVSQTSRTSIRPNQASMWQQIQVRSAQLNERNRQIEQAQKQQQQTQQTQTTKPSTNVNMLNNLSSAGVGKTNLSQTRMQQTTQTSNEKKQLPVAKKDEKQEVKEIDKKEQKQMEKNFREAQQSEYEYNKQKKEEEYQEQQAKATSGFEKGTNAVMHTMSKLGQKPKALYDGYQFGDVTGIGASTLVGAGTHAIEGVKSVADTGVALGAYGLGAGLDVVGTLADSEGLKNASKRLVESTKAWQKEDQEAVQKLNDLFDKNSILGESSNKAIESFGQSKTIATLGELGKGAQHLTTYALGAGGGISEAYEKENTKGWEALLKGHLGGTASLISENLFENPVSEYGGTKLTKGMEKAFGEQFVNGLSKGLARLGFSAVGEGAEEVIEAVLNKKLVNRILNTLLGEEKYDTDMDISEVVADALIASISTFGGGAPATIQQNRINGAIQNSNLNETQKEGLTKIAQENNLSEHEVKNIIEDTLGTENAQVEEKQPTTMENKPISENKQQTTQVEQKEAVNKSSEQIKENKQKEVKKQEEDAYNWESLMKQAELESGIEQEEEKIETPKQEVVKETPQETKQVEQKNEETENKPTIDDFNKMLDSKKNLTQEDKDAFRRYVDGKEITKELLDEYSKQADVLDKAYQEETEEKPKELPKTEKKEMPTTKPKEQDRFGFANDKDKGRQKLLATKHREFNETGKYDATEVLKLDKEIERNRNGKRTIKQWKDMAQELGRRIANKTDEEIEDIAVKSFYDLDILGRDENGKLKNITKYDRTLGKSASFDRLYASDWVNKVYEGVREVKQGTTQKTTINERADEYKKLSAEGFNERAGGEAVKEIFWKQWDKHNAETKKVLDKNGKKVEVKARKFSKDFVDKGFIDMRGKQINNTAELADLAQIFRNPKYETLRILYVKGNTIVGQEAVSSKLPRRNYNVY